MSDRLFAANLVHLEQLFSSKLEYGCQLIFAKQLLGTIGGSSGSQDGASTGVHALNDQVIQHHLLLGTVQDVLFYAAACEKPAVSKNPLQSARYARPGFAEQSTTGWWSHGYLMGSIR